MKISEGSWLPTSQIDRASGLLIARPAGGMPLYESAWESPVRVVGPVLEDILW